jgi:hypothetical protein
MWEAALQSAAEQDRPALSDVMPILSMVLPQPRVHMNSIFAEVNGLA